MDTGDWIIIIYMRQPSKEERKVIRKAKVVTRYIIDESKSMVMALIRFESSPIIYELVFDPTRYKAIEWKGRIEWWNKSNTVSILVIDSVTGIIEGIRVANMPKLCGKCGRNPGARVSVSRITPGNTTHGSRPSGSATPWNCGTWQHLRGCLVSDIDQMSIPSFNRTL
jgi:hypothetical protein